MLGPNSSYRFQVVSDVDRDGMGVEIVDDRAGAILAEAFRRS